MFEREIKEQIIEAGKRLYQKGFVASNDGNISSRVDEYSLIITPTGVCKGDMRTDQLLKVDNDGKVIYGDMKPTSEMKMHLAVYKARKDIKAIVHAHPPKATAFAVAHIPLDKIILPEAVISLGAVPLSEYGTPSTDEIPRSVEKVISEADAVLLANHGALTTGVNVMEAYFKMETIEHFATISLLARSLGGEVELNEEQANKLFKLKSEVYGKKGTFCTGCGQCTNPRQIHDNLPDCILAAELQKKGQDMKSVIAQIAEGVISQMKLNA